jgi:hypothetical protein
VPWVSRGRRNEVIGMLGGECGGNPEPMCPPQSGALSADHEGGVPPPPKIWLPPLRCTS